ncbi:DUF6928 family protein [Kitasatospora sp. NPDC101183]|uniref:DUF6928 family protein n=1 Tax=Kitasatospora sp. NPDC101183 TaxID=3364100 RepID=UPI0038045E5A
MGAKTGLLVYADGAVPGLLRQVGAPDQRRTAELMRRLYPGGAIDQASGSNLRHGVYPPKGRAYAGSWPGVELVCDQQFMIDFPSRLPGELVAEAVGLHGFLVRDPNAPDLARQEAALKAAVAAMGPPRIYRLGPDGVLAERESL